MPACLLNGKRPPWRGHLLHLFVFYRAIPPSVKGKDRTNRDDSGTDE